jgi:hypothetical protein
MNKPVIEFLSDGRISNLKLFGTDVSRCVRELHIEINQDNDPCNVTLSMKLNGINRLSEN